MVALEPNQRAFRILVVDDKRENTLLLSTLLESVGLDVHKAYSGQEAVAECLTWQPDLIWMDMRMPVMDGYEATRQIRGQRTGSNDQILLQQGGPSEQNLGENQSPQIIDSELRTPVIIALTASALEHEQRDILLAGCDDFVPKPFQEAVIFEKMTQYLGIKFIYAEQVSANPLVEPPAVLLSAQLNNLPSDWRERLIHALTIGNVKLAKMVAAELNPTHSNSARQIQQMLKDCQFDELLDLLEAARM